MSEAMLNGIEVLKSYGIVLSRIPKLAVEFLLTENPTVGNKSSFRCGLLLITKSALKVETEKNRRGFSSTPCAASIGGIVGCRKKNKEDALCLYLTLCALGLSDHYESTVGTLTGNAAKLMRNTAMEAYPADLALISHFESCDGFVDHFIAVYQEITAQRIAVAQKSAASVRNAK